MEWIYDDALWSSGVGEDFQHTGVHCPVWVLDRKKLQASIRRRLPPPARRASSFARSSLRPVRVTAAWQPGAIVFPGNSTSRYADLSHDDFAVAGHVIPAGSEIVISPYVQHRLYRFWNHPEHFAPSRFSTPASEGTYFPHGGGQRVCAARSLGIAEAKLILAEFVSRSTWAPLPGSDNLRQCVSVALRPAKLGLKFSAHA